MTGSDRVDHPQVKAFALQAPSSKPVGEEEVLWLSNTPFKTGRGATRLCSVTLV